MTSGCWAWYDGSRVGESMLKVFISHAPKEAAACGELEKQLRNEEAAQAVRLWHPGRLRGGDPGDRVRADRLREAQVVVALLSPDWIADGALLAEVRAALQRGAIVLPVLVRSCR